MTARPDARALRDFLARAKRRLTLIAAAEGASAGLALALFAIAIESRQLTAATIAVGAAIAAIAAIARILWTRRAQPNVAYVVEQRAPQCRNLLITAAELDAHPNVAEPVVRAIDSRAAELVRELQLSALLPARRVTSLLIIVSITWAIFVANATRPTSVIARATGLATGRPAITDIDVVLTPPAYAHRPEQTLHNPARIEALAGTRLHVTVHAHATRVVLETIRARDTLVSTNDAFVADLTADADGFVGIEPRLNDDLGPRRLIGLSVIPDNAPRVRITAPGKDLFLRDAHRTLDVAVDAGDDIGLASLRLRYTKVTGSGERFTFTEGELPISVTRADDRNWTARAQWNLESLGLEPGDMVVYRAVATDYRPGAAPSESDSYIAEVLAPGGIAAPGFDVDPEQERYAVSQQMVILKTERLAARRAQMSADDFATASAEIAAEQRKVRAEFVFMMGGELADAPDIANMTDINEEAEAAGEEDILAGRNANQGRVALLRAIRSMSRAATALTTADLTTALPHERSALAQLERAFSHARIILRALTERERLDLSRRLTGVLTDAARDTHPVTTAELDPRAFALRRELANVATLAGSSSRDAPSARLVAERVLQIDPASRELQQVSEWLTDAAAAIDRGRTGDALRLFDQGTTSLAAMLRASLSDAPPSRSAELDVLSGALKDAQRKTGGAR
jgi:hypothetical protein